MQIPAIQVSKVANWTDMDFFNTLETVINTKRKQERNRRTLFKGTLIQF